MPHHRKADGKHPRGKAYPSQLPQLPVPREPIDQRPYDAHQQRHKHGGHYFFFPFPKTSYSPNPAAAVIPIFSAGLKFPKNPASAGLASFFTTAAGVPFVTTAATATLGAGAICTG